ncbi:hypothetical protein ABT297_25700 [Dactylosporangium sp. NPDC000555]|uniref:hypothetical protein n=1 Tax=Dactylosporangium sp. NPDC000555 TaxID=3154260 RepID=UPI00331BDBD7
MLFDLDGTLVETSYLHTVVVAGIPPVSEFLTKSGDVPVRDDAVARLRNASWMVRWTSTGAVRQVEHLRASWFRRAMDQQLRAEPVSRERR